MDVAALRAHAESLEAQLRKLVDAQAELRRRLREVRVTVTSADELVTATVDARGQVERIELDPRIYQRPDSRQLAATITATVRQAVAASMEEIAELLRPHLPAEAMRAHLDLDLDALLELREAELSRE
jgi:DNA-binding protein YbaB